MGRDAVQDVVRLVAAGMAVYCMGPIRAAGRLTTKDRLQAIRRAQVWLPTDIPQANLETGPQGKEAFATNQTVDCDYRPHALGGSTPKFWCAMGSHVIKVRYGARNGEVYGHVAAARLLWALGFGANRTYPVRVACRKCPWDPYGARTREAGQPDTILFDPATVELKMDGKTLETKSDEGWSWKELDQIDETAGGAPRAQVDALKLLAVLVQHTDTKPSNQRLVCRDKTGADDDHADTDRCEHPFMMITDVGITFGRADMFNRDGESSVNFRNWSHTPVWKDEDRPGCAGDLSQSFGGTLFNPKISEAGRRFLADLLVQLSDRQLYDLFDTARFTERDRGASIDEWVNVFKKKRNEIVNRSCP